MNDPTVTPEHWTPELLSEERLNKICGRLMARQKAAVMFASLNDDPSQPLDLSRADSDADLRNRATDLAHIQDLIRHIGALRSPRQMELLDIAECLESDSHRTDVMIEDDVSLCAYVAKTLGDELTLTEANQVRVLLKQLHDNLAQDDGAEDDE